MNLRHLGDALDWWKGWLLNATNLAPRIRIVPMFTEAGEWTMDQQRLYARVLGVSYDNLLMRETGFTNEGRGQYFEQVAADAGGADVDLFVDPDTGIRVNWRTGDNRRQLIRTNEIGALLPSDGSRVVAVYRHAREGMEDLDAHVLRYATAVGRCSSFAVRGGSVTAVLFTRHRERLERVRNPLLDLLAPVVDQRVSALVSV